MHFANVIQSRRCKTVAKHSALDIYPRLRRLQSGAMRNLVVAVSVG
jgi:hypothetical protein